MCKLIFVACVFLAVFFVGTNSKQLPDNIKIKVVTKDEMKEILKQYPDAVELPSRTYVKNADAANEEGGIQPADQPKIVYKDYSFGKRILGDTLPAWGSGHYSWDTPHDISTHINYPTNGGQGAIITKFSNIVRQSDTGGKAYLLGGGICHRFINILLEIDQTYVFDYDIDVFGYV